MWSDSMNLSMPGERPIEILLVEDELGEAKQTMQALKDGRVRNRVHWVEEGELAIAFLSREGEYARAPRPDLILLDLDMPRMNGLEVLAIIKEHPDWKRIPVVIMTRSEKEKDILTAYNLHANCYVTKPMDAEKFLAAIRSIEDFWMSIVRLPAA
jgi:CheY-like chemotaxis protein